MLSEEKKRGNVSLQGDAVASKKLKNSPKDEGGQNTETKIPVKAESTGACAVGPSVPAPDQDCATGGDGCSQVKVKNEPQKESSGSAKDGMQVDEKKQTDIGFRCDEGILAPARDAIQYQVMPSMALDANATGPNFKILVMFTGKVRNSEDGTSCRINFLYLGKAEPGYTKAPYEPEINGKSDIKHKIYIKDGKKTVPDTTLNEVWHDTEKGNETTFLKCNSFEKHPSKYFETRGRGEGTGTVGYLKPDVPLSVTLFCDGGDTKFADETHKGLISAFTLGHLTVTVPRVNRCMPPDETGDSGGYGIQVKRVLNVFQEAPPYRLFNTKHFLDDLHPVDVQLGQKLAEDIFPDKKWNGPDMQFVRKMTSGAVQYGNPLVVIDLKVLRDSQPDREICASVEVNADGKSLQMTLHDSSRKSIYDNKCFNIHIPKNMFPSEDGKLNIMWAHDFIDFAIRTKQCTIIVMHNPRSVGTDNPQYCMILSHDDEFLVRGIKPRHIELPVSILQQFIDEDKCALQKRDVLHLDAKDEDGKPVFSAWANNEKENKLHGSGREFLYVLKTKPMRKKGVTKKEDKDDELPQNTSFFFSLIDANSIPTSDFYVCYFCEFLDGKLERVIISGLLKPNASLLQLPVMMRANTVGLLDQFECA